MKRENGATQGQARVCGRFRATGQKPALVLRTCMYYMLAIPSVFFFASCHLIRRSEKAGGRIQRTARAAKDAGAWPMAGAAPTVTL